MNTLTSTLRDSIASVLGGRKAPPSAAALQGIRRAMLALLPEQGDDPMTLVRQRIAQTQDIEGLWYVRAELFNHLCQVHDEVHAARCLQTLEPLFQHHLPSALLKTRQPGALRRGRSRGNPLWAGPRG